MSNPTNTFDIITLLHYARKGLAFLFATWGFIKNDASYNPLIKSTQHYLPRWVLSSIVFLSVLSILIYHNCRLSNTAFYFSKTILLLQHGIGGIIIINRCGNLMVELIRDIHTVVVAFAYIWNHFVPSDLCIAIETYHAQSRFHQSVRFMDCRIDRDRLTMQVFIEEKKHI